MTKEAHEELVKTLKEAIQEMAGEDGEIINIDYEVLANVAIDAVKDYILAGYE